MGRVTKPQIKAHEEALRLASILETIPKWDGIPGSDRNPRREAEQYILDNFDPNYSNLVVKAGIFFTPDELARDLRIQTEGCNTIIDLCAGIGHLSYWLEDMLRHDRGTLVCVEINPEFVAIGKKLVPYATWICADILDPALPSMLPIKKFDMAISNPPFGSNIPTKGKLNYKGSEFEYKTIEVASRLAYSGAFIISQTSSPIIHYPERGQRRENIQEKYIKFNKETGIEISPNCGLNANIYKDQWKGAAPNVEIVTCDFQEVNSPTLF